MRWSLKVAFFQKVRFVFFKSPNLQKKIFQKTILSLKFKFPANNTLLFGIIFFEIWRSEKRTALSEKEPTLKRQNIYNFLTIFVNSDHSGSNVRGLYINSTHQSLQPNFFQVSILYILQFSFLSSYWVLSHENEI